MAITPLPTPPTRSDSANFATRGDAFMAALPTFATEANATAAAMDTALQTSMLGVTATSTTSLAIGTGSKSLTVETGKGFVVGMSLKIASTASPTNYMIGTVTGYTSGTGALTVDVDTVGGSGTIAAWTVSIATMGDIEVAGGATETTSAVDITLTSASERVQIINMTATGKIVTLPDATTMSEGGISYIFRATGYSYLVLSSTGRFVATVESDKVVQVSLVDNSTAAGTWTGQMLTDVNPGVGIGIPSVFETAASNYLSAVWLDSTRCFVAYQDGGNSNYLTGCVLTKTGATLVPSSPSVIISTATARLSVALIGSDKIMVFYYDNSATCGKAVVITITGTAVDTIGTPIVVNSATSGDANFLAMCRIEDDKVFVAFKIVTSNYLGAKILTVSGTTITANTLDTYSFTAAHIHCTLLDTNKILCCFQQAAGATVAVAYTVSGTTLTRGTAVAVDGSVAGSYIVVSPLSTSKAIMLYSNAASPYSLRYCVLTITGTTITYGTAAELSGSTTKYASGVLGLGATSALGLWLDSNKLILAALSIAATGVVTPTVVSDLTSIAGEPMYGHNHLASSPDNDVVCTYTAVTTTYGTALLLVG